MHVELLPASRGDAILIEWRYQRRTYRMLVDGGPQGAYRNLHERIRRLRRSDRRLDVLVVTHIDGDHIEGVIRLLQDRQALQLTVGDIWFNGYEQLSEPVPDLLGPAQGEFLAALIQRDDLPHNVTPGGVAEGWIPPVAIGDGGPLPRVCLPGGATATILSPGPGQLAGLRTNWVTVLAKAGMTPGDDRDALARLEERTSLLGMEPAPDMLGEAAPDDSVANASSIAFLLEHEGSSLLLTGDGHGDVLSAGLRRLLAERDEERLCVGAVKAPHHGSAGNVTAEFVDLVRSPRWLFSSDSSAGYRHPHPAAIERVIGQASAEEPVTLMFNYRSEITAAWAEPKKKWAGRYVPVYPGGSGPGITTEVQA